MTVDSGQFIGLSEKVWPSLSMRNMFSLYRSQWPDASHRRWLTTIGVETSR